MEQEFFTQLQRHSDSKLQILNHYVVPWMRKITFGLNGKCLVIDGFAGQGKYEDNSDGSPLILLKAAIEFCQQADQKKWPAPNIYLIFVEGLKDNYQKLKEHIFNTCGVEFSEENFFAKVPLHPSISVACINEEFKNVLNYLLDQVNDSLIPSFCFIDPFGFSDTPMTVIQRYMKNQRAEMLMNFIFEETNRFIKFENPKIQDHISQHFGVTTLEELKELIGDAQGDRRKQIIVDYYSRQLVEQANVKHVLNFEIKKNGRTKLILFYGTKSRDGLKLMKSVMWKVDGTGSYVYDDRKDPRQISFSFAKDINDAEMVGRLADQIHDRFRGRMNVRETEIDDFVLLGTIFPIENYCRPALKLLERDKRIKKVAKVDGSPRKHGFNAVYINFA